VITKIDLPAEPASPGRARRFVTDTLGDVATDVDRAALLVSELVTNAVLHAGTELEVAVEIRPRLVQVSVRDGSGARPAVRRYDRYAATGRGLHLLETLADRWGVDVEPEQKRVWFELAREAPSAEERRRAKAAAVPPRAATVEAAPKRRRRGGGGRRPEARRG
jgi:anti-sigma regulatory factor (Ser/Thr protein kinase)